ncbi:hypothetical protein K501DRAFT_319760 [Backusella circina FSU 941]|nr:hypothetical protein K501DRAFT_319760 [Backusella circina FSU 941]
MSNYYGLNTPSSRDNNRLFEQGSPERHSTMQQTPYLTFTPCTRLSRMTIDSQSNGVSGRTIRPNIFQLPVTNFNEKLMEAVKEEESPHPNLTMFLGSDKISIFDKKKNGVSSLFSDDEESDEGDLFSSSLSPMSTSPPDARPSIFDTKKYSIFDEDTEFESVFPLSDHDQHYDLTNSWVSSIYQDDDCTDNDEQTFDNNNMNNNQEDKDENRAPRIWQIRKQDNEQKQKKLIRSSSHEDNGVSSKRLPLQEIKLEDYISDDEPPARKKVSVTTTENTHKIRFIRSLSPTRNAKRKGKEVAENIMPN